MKNIFIIAALGMTLIAVSANAQQFQLIPKADASSGITMTIPYDLGTHHGVASQVTGFITASQNFNSITGKLIVPLLPLVRIIL